jgi:hypothetical protein
MKKDVLSMIDLRDEVPLLLDMAANVKEWHKTGQPYEPLRGRTQHPHEGVVRGRDDPAGRPRNIS